MLNSKKAEILFKSGIENYHHNLETARSYFPEICTTHEYDEDIETIETARDAGFKICCGGIIGLGETWEQRIELAFTLKDLDLDSIPLNFLNPVPGTRLGENEKVKPLDALKTVSLFRFINSEKNIGIAGGREITLGDFQSWVIPAGANRIMIGDYLTTKGRSLDMDLEMLDVLKGILND
jgi:biotin synthase